MCLRFRCLIISILSDTLKTLIKRKMCFSFVHNFSKLFLSEKNILQFAGVNLKKHLAMHVNYPLPFLVKVNVPPIQATKVLKLGRGIALPFLRPRHRRWVWGVSTTPRPLCLRERPGTHCTGGWVVPRVGLDGCGKSRTHRDSIPGPSSP